MFRTKNGILRGLNPHNPASIQELINFHRRTLGGFVMEDDKDNKDGQPDADKDGAGKDGAEKDGARQSGAGQDGTDKDKSKDGDEPLGPGGQKALEAERDARKALQTELNQFKTAQNEQTKKLAEAFGIKSEDAKSTDDVVTALQKQVQDMQRDNLVFRVVTDPAHLITDADDLDLIKAAPDEATMRKLAARLAKKAAADDKKNDDDGKQTRRFPRQDSTQGRGGDKPFDRGEAGRAEARRRFPSKTQ